MNGSNILFYSFTIYHILPLFFLQSFSYHIMPPFRFHIPFFSYGSPSRLSSGTSSPSPPPTPPSRPPFRPAGIAQPSKPATSAETKSKMSPSLSRAKSNVAAIVASFSASQSPSRGVATPTRLAKQSNQLPGSPLKKPESLKTEEQKVTMKEKPSRESVKEAEETQEQRKNTEAEKLEAQEKKKVLHKDMEGKSETAQRQLKMKETESNQQSSSPSKKSESLRSMDEKPSKEIEKEGGKNINTVIEKPPIARSEREKAEASRSRTTRHITAASESERGLRDLPERKIQNRAEIHTSDNHPKGKGVTTGNARDTKGEGSSSMSKRIKEDIRDGISKLAWGKSNGDNEKSVSVYTLTGENRGATMAIASEKDKKDGEVYIRRGYRSNPNESPNTTSTETEGERKTSKDKNPKDNEDKEEARFRAYVNGNTQAINNSIVLESSVSENDPGIHMNLKFEVSKKEITNPPENVPEKKPETVTETPRVRRRCLRGLLAESSESENPSKPRRHGCRFTCKDKDIKNT